MTLRIFAKGGGQYKEADANEAITPGHLIEINSSGKAIKQASIYSTKAVAIEFMPLGRDRDTAYAANDRVLYRMAETGDEVYCLVKAAAAAVAYGALLKADASAPGCVITVANTTENAIAIGKAMAAVDNSAGGTQARIRVEFL